jgi:hypothetical protein
MTEAEWAKHLRRSCTSPGDCDFQRDEMLSLHRCRKCHGVVLDRDIAEPASQRGDA